MNIPTHENMVEFAHTSTINVKTSGTVRFHGRFEYVPGDDGVTIDIGELVALGDLHDLPIWNRHLQIAEELLRHNYARASFHQTEITRKSVVLSETEGSTAQQSVLVFWG